MMTCVGTLRTTLTRAREAECMAEPQCAGWTFVRNDGQAPAILGGRMATPCPLLSQLALRYLPFVPTSLACPVLFGRTAPPCTGTRGFAAWTAVLVDIGTDGAEDTASRVWRGGGAVATDHGYQRQL